MLGSRGAMGGILALVRDLREEPRPHAKKKPWQYQGLVCGGAGN